MPDKAQSLKAASLWYVRMHEAEVSSADTEAFHRWLSASDCHRQAWQAVEQLDLPFAGVDSQLGQAVLTQRTVQTGRRQVLKKFGAVFIVAGTGSLMYQFKPWTTMLADYATAKGEQRSLSLPDGTMVVLNTGSALDVRFSDTQRMLVLLKGEAMVMTGHVEGNAPPLQLQTRHGIVTALGTRFSARDLGNTSLVQVFEHAVRLEGAEGRQQVLIEAGHSLEFGIDHHQALGVVNVGADLWVKGILSVNDMPLRDFLLELGRYHEGYIRCAEELDTLLISGSFPVHDLAGILTSLQETFHLRVDYFTRYWITLKPA